MATAVSVIEVPTANVALHVGGHAIGGGADVTRPGPTTCTASSTVGVGCGVGVGAGVGDVDPPPPLPLHAAIAIAIAASKTVPFRIRPGYRIE